MCEPSALWKPIDRTVSEMQYLSSACVAKAVWTAVAAEAEAGGGLGSRIDASGS